MLADVKDQALGPLFGLMKSREVAARERILLKQSGDHSRVDVGTYAYNHTVSEIDDPAVSVSEPHTVRGRRQ